MKLLDFHIKDIKSRIKAVFENCIVPEDEMEKALLEIKEIVDKCLANFPAH